MFSWLSNTDRNWEGAIWKKHSVHINYDFQLCKAERRDKRWVGFFLSHVLTFSGEEDYDSSAPAVESLSGLQPEIPPPRERLRVLICSLTFTATNLNNHHSMEISVDTDTWHALFLPFGLFEKVRWITYDGIYLHNFTCCEAFRESATFLTQQWTALECFSTLPPSPWKLHGLLCKNSANVKAARVQPDTKQNVAYHVQPHSFIPLGPHTSSCAHCSQSGAGKDKRRYGSPASSETESNSSNAHIASLLRHMCCWLVVHANVSTLVCLQLQNDQ